MHGSVWVSTDLMPLIFPQAIIIPFLPPLPRFTTSPFLAPALAPQALSCFSSQKSLSSDRIWFQFAAPVSGLERASVPDSVSIFPPAADAVTSL